MGAMHLSTLLSRSLSRALLPPIDRVLRKFSRELNYKIPHQERITEVNKNLAVLLFYSWLLVMIGSTAN